MPKSIKLKNNTYWDSSSITHNKKLLSDILYPVGSIYMSVDSTSPATLFGGTWTQISGRFLYCTTTSKNTGGANSVSYTPAGTVGGTSLTIDQIPTHSHEVRQRRDNPTPYSTFYNSNYTNGQGEYCHTAGSKMVNTGSTDNLFTLKVGGGKTHNHSFTGTKATINTMPAYFTVYCWYRTA